MKATGIVRRIDDLGRVVIPKEIRRTMRIREGDPLEIYTDNDGEVIFKKYSPIGELSNFAAQFAEVLGKSSGYPVLISDRDRIISSFGIPRKEVLERRVSEELEALLEQRRPYICEDGHHLTAVDGLEKSVAVAVPILAAGDMAGAVILLDTEENAKPGDVELKLAQTAANFLAKQMEE
ncbi:stage V sporulation T C-terminal domain-containing protein [Ethanoligenens harbinense]|uniref:Transcriptional regulator, AbrB family n=1 Tax=Ethanoligenens harbinense (strain DSM 18485 / JCM 12961 / CGMCC 1.5033 / YUAN-3) TaxID=663278 RepID=E6U7E5_ETHHY|nr:stage V sporulation T C-terminal domain-containing protein [Ethanoligenens harbinense]ADU25880.1 transcriptional regulator, AbrB family [Ethanoligenens harbinense YUAN-3]AVQ95040.1 stage V sporulation protein T [Ethanoligenens harbinense YUAN-3]AYF37731.1 stage V sporulation protein T [Ethanoligenens harbinense]AYF40452.1 stage V sporulation protein T [Ethanoligenens harbinense]QCN91287.1 AbrB/MazE/SpoVT family DNA-binding domain-containing protein [Ethanoligenens harbinense]